MLEKEEQEEEVMTYTKVYGIIKLIIILVCTYKKKQ